MSSEIDRRQLLKGATLGAAALGTGILGSALTTSLPEAAAVDRIPHGKLSDIKHVVFLMMENRGFDHMFGKFPGVRGFDDRSVKQADGKSVYRQRTTGIPGLPSTVLPFRIDTSLSKNGPRPGQCTQNTGTDDGLQWDIYHANYHGMADWVTSEYPTVTPANAPLVMGYYQRQDLPFLYSLAEKYTICDNYYSSIIGGTDLNRIAAWTGTIDPDGWDGGGQFLDTVHPPRSPSLFDLGAKGKWKTYPEVLERAGISWRFYQGDPGQLQNPLVLFSAYSNPDSPLYQKGIEVTGSEFTNETFAADCRNGTLPSVSWFASPLETSQHAPFPMAWGETVINNVITALQSNPEVWKSTALFITWDECGGFFDHVRPPVPHGAHELEGEQFAPGVIKPRSLAYAQSDSGTIRGPVGLGYRVPMIIVSPFTKGGFVSSDRFDHTSMLRFVERRFGARVPRRNPKTQTPGLSQWRLSEVGDLTSAFNFAAKPDYRKPSLPATPIKTEEIYAQCVITGEFENLAVHDLGLPYPLPKFQRIPHQERAKHRVRRPSGPVHG